MFQGGDEDCSLSPLRNVPIDSTGGYMLFQSKLEPITDDNMILMSRLRCVP